MASIVSCIVFFVILLIIISIFRFSSWLLQTPPVRQRQRDECIIRFGNKELFF